MAEKNQGKEKKMTIQEMINVLQDALDGKKIEVRYKDRSRYHDEWTPALYPAWDFSLYDYRAKPETSKPSTSLMRPLRSWTRLY